MGFQEEIPPVPTRTQELQMIKRLEQDWLNQRYYKYYMNENLRRKKMQYSAAQNKVRADFYLNMALYGLITAPIVIFTSRFIRYTRLGVPIFHQPYFFETYRSGIEARRKIAYKIQIPLWFGLTYFLAQTFTDTSLIEDENYQQAKDIKML